METDSKAHNINNGIHGPDFMEMDLIDAYPMHGCLRLRKEKEYLPAQGTSAFSKAAGVNNGININKVSMPVVILPAIHDKLLAPDTILDCFLNIDFIFMKVELPKLLPEEIDVNAQIQQGRHGHIPADSRETVEIEDFLPVRIHFSIYL